jgi:ABC-2 type transport system permease protein/oleandomycin transport system permease protein
MTTVSTTAAVRPRGAPALLEPLQDALAITTRNLISYKRVPQLLVFSTIQPIIFVLMFRYVFGGAVRGIHGSYVDYLMPGVFTQTVVFGAIAAAVGLATDVQSGLLERFRSLPMSRSAVLAGRTIADSVRNVVVILLMVLVGYGVGWRAHASAAGLVGGMLLVLLFGYALAWIFAALGLAVADPETAQAAAFPVLGPLVFASSAFVSTRTMPGWLQAFANHQPVSITASAVRALTEGHTVAGVGSSTTSLVLQSVAWCVGIVAVFAPVAVARYRRVV